MLWAGLAALAGAATAAPLWSSTFLPFQDAPQHLASIRVLADYQNAAFGFKRWFEIDLRHSQYVGFYLPAALLARLVGPQAACRLLLTLIALAIPLATWMLLGAFGRDQRLAVFSPLVFHTAPLYLGFFNFVASIPVTIFVVALTEREIKAPSPRRASLLVLATAGLYYLHPSAVALSIASGAVLAATSGFSWRRALRGVAPLFPAAMLLVGWALAARMAPQPFQGRATPYWQPFKQQIQDLVLFGNVLAGNDDELFVLAFFVVWLAAALVPGRPRLDRAFRLPLLAALLLAAYLPTPVGFATAWFIHLRALPLLAIATLSSPSLSPRRATSILIAAAVALQIAYAARLVSAYRAFDREAEARDFQALLASAEPGRRLLTVVYEPDSKVVQFKPYLHFGLYYEVERGGRARYNFADLPWTPIRFRPETHAVPLEPGWDTHPARFDPGREGADTDYLLLRGAGPDPGPRFRLGRQAGHWSLFVARGLRAAAP